MGRGAGIALGITLAIAVVLASLYFALAIHYWIPWPAPVRTFGALAFPAAMLALWFAPGRRRRTRRVLVAVAFLALGTAYAAKLPAEQDWVALQSEQAFATFDDDTVTIANLRDALHRPGAPSEPRWITARFDLSTLEGVDLIIQPFGGVKALAHVMLSFRFADGRHVVVSMEARQAKGAAFDPVAGFFRRDQLYPELGTERDLIWERLARTPPDEVQIYPVKASAEAVRIYFRRILDFVNASHRQPRFYSTLRESCMTTLMNLAPESFAQVPWRDLRRWIPGYSLSLFQQLGLVDGDLGADDLAREARLRPSIRPPAEFPADAAWSAHIRARRP
ncbi:DUF4105 domain-containing protein [Xanthobacter sp. KR7-225]|uniref:lipoprotein N-acyltransferase Lnb domain-containing protein n=1 Tax=Xanthobacter sp. KR7-225 TaxID=3156613 RepID=UPI0032B37AC5